jgi:hypothetical protein
VTDKTHGTFRMVAVLLIAVALVSVALTGCGGSTASSAHSGTVSANDYKAIVTALKADGVVFTDEAGLRMVYSLDKKHVTVYGDMTVRMNRLAGKPLASVQLVEVELKDGKWTRVTQ